MISSTLNAQDDAFSSRKVTDVEKDPWDTLCIALLTLLVVSVGLLCIGYTCAAAACMILNAI